MAPGWVARAGREVVRGAVLGAVVLGIGGRVVMAIVQHQATGTWSFTVGGSLTVVAMGALSGVAGAVLLLLSRAAGRRVSSSRWPEAIVFAALLLLVTLRGLSGSPAPGRWYFFPLVAVFGAALLLPGGRSAARASGAPDG